MLQHRVDSLALVVSPDKGWGSLRRHQADGGVVHIFEAKSVDDASSGSDEAGLASIGGVGHITVLVGTDLNALWLIVKLSRGACGSGQKKGLQKR